MPDFQASIGPKTTPVKPPSKLRAHFINAVFGTALGAGSVALGIAFGVAGVAGALAASATAGFAMSRSQITPKALTYFSSAFTGALAAVFAQVALTPPEKPTATLPALETVYHLPDDPPPLPPVVIA